MDVFEFAAMIEETSVRSRIVEYFLPSGDDPDDRRLVAACLTDLLHDGPPRTAAEAPPPTTTNEAFLAAMVEGDPRYFMRRSEARALVRDFGMEVYSHSAGHRPCFRSRASTVDAKGARASTVSSRRSRMAAACPPRPRVASR